MTVPPSPRWMTADELLALPGRPGERCELVRGQLRARPYAGALAGVFAARLGREIARFVEDRGLGVCGTGGSGLQLRWNSDTVRVPSFWFVRSERVPGGGIPNTYWPGTPDLAVEVLSPSDRFKEVMEKVQDYLEAGTPMVWAIDPQGRSAAVFQPGQPPRLLREDGVRDGEDVVPGFCVALRDILP